MCVTPAHVLALALALLLFAATCSADGFSPSPPIGITYNYTYAAATGAGFQLCYQFPYSTQGPNKTDIDLACVGALLMMGCGNANDTMLRQVAAEGRAIVFGGDVVAGPTRFFYNTTAQMVNGTGVMGYVNASVPAITDCLATSPPSAMCWRINPDTTRPIAVGSCTGTTVLGSTVIRAIFSTPCATKVENDTCVTPGDACAVGAQCNSVGACVGGVNPGCPPPGQCETFVGQDQSTCQCIYAPRPIYSTCNGTDFCKIDDYCDGAGTCLDGNATYACPIDQCTATSTCNNATQSCVTTPRANGTACNDGLNCTTTSACDGNYMCIGTPKVCPSTNCLYNGTCNETNAGICDYTPAPMGTTCNQGFTSQCELEGECDGTLGVCVPTVFVDCGPILCRSAGMCDPHNGLCFNRTSDPNGTPCTPVNPCSVDGICLSGSCIGQSNFACPPPPTNCYLPSTRTAVNGTCTCTLNPLDGASCTTMNPCISGVCDNGTCVTFGVVTCNGDQCNFPLVTCSPSDACYNPKPDNTSCTSSNGCPTTCTDGMCLNPVVCGPASVLVSWLVWLLG